MNLLGMTCAGLDTLDPDRLCEVAALAEAAGYDSIWTVETTGYDAFSILAAVGGRTLRAGLGTGVVPLQLHHPTQAAMAAATLQSIHPDREILVGIGVSSPVVVGRWHGLHYPARPLSVVREYVAALRACLSGEQIKFSGDHYSIPRFRLGVPYRSDRRPRVVMAALGPRMLRLAGEIADGVLLNNLPASLASWSVNRVREGGDATVWAYVHAGIGDRASNRAEARQRIFTYAVADAYARSFATAGFAREVEDVRARHRDGDRSGAVAAVSDALVDAIDLVGTEGEVQCHVESYVRAGVERPIVRVLSTTGDLVDDAKRTLEAVASFDGLRSPGAHP